MALPNVFSVDLEDWFHVLDSPGVPPLSEWASCESRVRANAQVMLDEFDTRGVRCTFFVLGWIAQQQPKLVKEIAERGHEIASHGHHHNLVYQQKEGAFREDLLRANDAIHDACGQAPQGYRAPGFSITAETPWALDVLAGCGFAYDSSIFPAPRAHGGLVGATPNPFRLANGLMEFPVSTVPLGRSRRLAYLGGGYLRFFPDPLIRHWARRQQAQGIPLVLYIHPRDIDPDQPRLRLGAMRNFKRNVGLASCLSKLRNLLDEFEWTSFANALKPESVGP